jgi:phosphate uptake regulator
MQPKEMYSEVCHPTMEGIRKDVKENQSTIVEVLNKLKNGITERLTGLEKRLDRVDEQIDKLYGLATRLLIAIIGLFGSMIVGLVIVIVRGITG